MSNGTPPNEEEMKLEALRKALVEGEDSGTAGPFEFEAFIARKRATGRRAEEKSGE